MFLSLRKEGGVSHIMWIQIRVVYELSSQMTPRLEKQDWDKLNISDTQEWQAHEKNKIQNVWITTEN